MKKSLYMTTALAAASVLAFGATGATDAMAAEKAKAKPVKLSLSGFFNTRVGFSEQDAAFESTNNSTARTGYDSFNVYTDSEINFKGSTKLDNGVAVSVTIQLETDQTSSGQTIDESWVGLSGGFGALRVGTTKSAGFLLKHSPPSAGAIGLGDPDTGNWIIKPTAIAGISGTDIGAGDNMKLVYTSPAFSGFKFGGSYEPSSASSNLPAAIGGTAGTDNQKWDVMFAYNSKLGGTTIGADVGYWEQHGTSASTYKAWRGGLSLGFGAITLGMAYKDKQDVDGGSPGTTANGMEAFDVGVTYKSGPMTLGTKYYSASSPQTTAVAGSDQVDKVSVGASYTLGAGVTLVGTIVHVDWDDELTTDANNNDGWAAIGGINVAF